MAARFGDVLRVAGIVDQVDAARAAGLQHRPDAVHQAGVLAQVDAEARRIEAAAEHRVAELERVVVGIGARQGRGSAPAPPCPARGWHPVPRSLRRDSAARPADRWAALWAARAPGAEVFRDDRRGGGLGRDLADDDDGRQIGTEHLSGSRRARLASVSARTLGRGHAQARIVRGKQRRAQRALREKARARVAGGHGLRELRLRITSRAAAAAPGAARCRPAARRARSKCSASACTAKSVPALLARADGIERALKGEPVELLAAEGQQPLEHLARRPPGRPGSSVSGRLRMWPNTLTVSLTSSGCTISVRPLGSVLTTGCGVERRHGRGARVRLAAQSGSAVGLAPRRARWTPARRSLRRRAPAGPSPAAA